MGETVFILFDDVSPDLQNFSHGWSKTTYRAASCGSVFLQGKACSNSAIAIIVSYSIVHDLI